MQDTQIVTLIGPGGTSLFMVWQTNAQQFLAIEEHDRWTDWQAFKGDLRSYWSKEIDPSGSHTNQRFLEYLQTYERNAPSRLVAPRTPIQKAESDRKVLQNIWIAGGVLVFTIVIVGSVIWDQGVAPLLGRLGLMNYSSPAQQRYKRFLGDVAACTPQKTVSTGAHDQVPTFQTFLCPGGQEVVWAHRVEVIKRSGAGGWVLEPSR